MALNVNLNKQLLTSLDKLIAGLEALDKTVKDTNKTAKRLETAFDPKTLTNFVAALKTLDRQATTSFSNIARSVGQLVTAVSTLKRENAAVFPALAKILASFNSTNFKNLPGKSQLANATTLISDFLSSFDKLQTVNVGSLDNFDKVLEQFRKLIQDLVRLSTKGIDVRKLRGLKQIGRVVVFLANDLGRIAKAIDQVNRLGATVQINEGITRLFDGLNRLFEALKPGRLQIPVIGGVFRFVRQLGRLASIFVFLRLTIGQIASVAQRLRNENLLDAVDIISRVFDRLGRAIRTIINTLEKLPAFNPIEIIRLVLRTERLVGVLAKVIKGIANAVKGLSPEQAVSILKVGQAVDAFARGLVPLLNTANSLPIINVSAVIQNFIRTNKLIGLIAKIVKGIARSVKDLPDAPRLGGLLDIAKFIRELTGATRQLGSNKPGSIVRQGLFELITQIADTVDERKIKKFSRIITAITKGFAPLKGIQIDVGGVIKGLPQLLEVLEKITKNKIDVRGFDSKGLKRFFRDVASALSELDRVQVNDQKLTAISEIVKNIEKLPANLKIANVQKPAEQLGVDIADSVARGFLKANLIITFSRVLTKAFLAFNPITLAAKFSGAFVNAINTVRSNLRNLINGLNEVGRKVFEIGDNLRNFGSNISQNFGLQKIFQSTGFEAAVDFDKLSTQLQVFGNLTDEELKAAQDFANQIGIDYPLSANEALEATLDLNKAGLDLASTFTTLPAAADLAALSESGSLETATQTIIGATKAFKEFADGVPASFENAGFAATLFAGAADASTASTESLNEGMANIGATASTFGLSLADTLSILAALDDAQIKGAEGGTALRSVLTQLNSAAGQAELQRLGVSLTDAEGNFRDLDAVFKDLNEALNGTKLVTTTVTNLTADQTKVLNTAQKAYSDAEGKILLYNEQLQAGVIDQDTYNKKVEDQQEILNRTSGVITEITGSITETNRITSELTRNQQENAESAKLLFGAYGLAAGSVLLANNGFDDYRQKVLSAEEANIRAQKLLDNLAGDFEQLRGSVETLLTKAFLPLINRALRPIVKLGRTVIDFFLSLPEPILEIATNTVLLVSAFASFIGVGSIVAGLVLQFGGAFLTASTALAGLLFNTGIGATALLALAGSAAALVATFTIALTVFTAVSALITSVFRAIESNSGGAGTALGKLRGSISGLFNVIRKTFGKFGNAISQVFGEGNPDAIGGALAAVFDSITVKVRGLIGAFGKFNRAFDFETFKGNLYFVRLGIENISKSVKSLVQGGGFGELDKTFGTIAAGVTKIFGQLTGKDLSKLFSTFMTEGFSAGLKSASEQLKTALQEFFRNNESQIKDVLTSFVNLFIPGRIVVPILRALGLNDLADSVGAIFNDIRNTISKIIGTIVDVLKGQSLGEALLGNFGEKDGSAINRALSSIGRAIGKVVEVFQSLFKALFPGGAGSGQTFLELAFNGIATAFDLFTNVVLTPLQFFLPPIISLLRRVVTAFSTIAGGILGRVAKAFEPLIQTFADFFSGSINFGEFAGRLLQSVVQTVVTLIQQLPGALGDIFVGVGQLIGSPFFTKLGEELQNGNLTGVLTTVAQGIWEVIKTAILLVPTLITNLGEALGSPILTKLGDALKNGDFSTAIDTIATGIKNLIEVAIGKVPELITNLGELLNLQPLVDLGNNLKESPFITQLTTALQNIATLPLTVITSVVGSINEIIDTLANNPDAGKNLGNLVAGLLGLSGALVLLNANQLLTVASTGITKLSTALNGIVAKLAPIAAVVALILAFKNAIQLVSDLLSGENFFQALGDFFINFGADLAGLFGIDISAEKLSQTLSQALAVITLGFERFIRDLLNKFRIAGQNVSDAAANIGDDIAARLGTLGARQSEVYFALGERLGSDSGTALFQGLGFELTKAAEQNEPGIRELILRQLRVNFTKIVDEFRTVVPDLATVDDTTFQAIANTIIGAGALEDAFRIVAEQQGPAGLNAFVQRLIEDAPTALAGANIDDLGFILQSSIADGLLTTDNAISLLDSLVVAGTISQEKRDQIKKDIEAILGREIEIINTAIQTGEGTTPIEVPVTPTVQGADDGSTPWYDNLITDTEGLINESGGLPVEVTPTVPDDAGATIEQDLATQTPPEIPTNIDVDNLESVEDGTQALLDLQNQTALTEGALVTFQAQTSAVTLAINESSLAIQAYGVVAGLTIGGVSLAWLGYNGVVTLVSQNIVNNITNVQVKLFEFADAMTAKFEILRGVIQDIGNALLSLPEGLPSIPGGGGGGSGRDDGGPRALGGSVNPKKFYEVFDTDKPELLEHGGKYYLLPNAQGRVTPMNAVSQRTPALAGAMAGGGSMNVQINAPITIDVSNLPAGVNAADVAQIVSQRVDSAFRETQNTLIRRLRRAGAQGIDG